MPRPTTGPYARQPRNPVRQDDLYSRHAATAPYQLQQLQESAGGWRLLAGYRVLEAALEAGPKKSGHVRVVRRRRDQSLVTVAQWRNGRAVSEETGT